MEYLQAAAAWDLTWTLILAAEVSPVWTLQGRAHHRAGRTELVATAQAAPVFSDITRAR